MASSGRSFAHLWSARFYLPEIQSMIEARNFTALRELFSEMPPADVAEIILDLPEDEQVIIFRILPHALAADVFEYLDVDVEAQQQLLRGDGARTGRLDPQRDVAGRPHRAARGTPERGGAAADPSAHAGRAAHRTGAARLSGGQRRAFDDAGSDRGRRELGRCRKCSITSAQHGQDSETLNVIYVVDDRGKLIDDVRIREFLLKPLDDESERFDG